jgi:hypothetical protein
MKFLFNSAIYDSEIHANIPAGAVEISEEEYLKIITPPSKYHKWNGEEWILDEEAKKKGECSDLWKATTDYTEAQINAAELARTVDFSNKGNTKATENIVWYDTVWRDYYERCQEVQGGSIEISFDFSNNGTKPWKFFEVVATV